ncbi:MAG TPA: head GIN domain-containing protein [Cyclobacteriaceae bacterium]|nr:head GIN domain-containing protein [Cyclobacteriaceae bacterium]
MKKLAVFVLLLISGVAFAQTKETRKVGSFSKLSFRVPGKLILKQGSTQSVVLEGDQDFLSKVETEIDGDRLVIGREDKWSWRDWRDGNNNNKITAYVTMTNIEGLGVGGSGDLVGEGKFSTGDIELKVSGSGSMQIEIEAKGDMKADVSGSGDIDVKGTCQSFDSGISGSGKVNAQLAIAGKAEVSISGSGKLVASGTAKEIKARLSGSGKVLASNLEVSRCDVHISGSGDVEINVKDALDASISGSGSVSYKGNPSQLNSHSSGSGHVRKM